MNASACSSSRGPLRAVVLDWAGTTVDYGCMAPTGAFVEVFGQHDVPISIAESRGPMGAAKRAHIQGIAADPGVAARWRQTHGRDCTEADVDSMYAAFVPLQLSILSQYADLIPGCVEAIAAFRERGCTIGSTTGYTREMMDVLEPEAARRGYAPDVVVAADEVLAGRPAPWMALRAAERLGVYPMECVVKVGDTVADVHEGLNAGMWSIGLAQCGNELGLPEAEVAALEAAELERRLVPARKRLAEAGAHYVVDSIGDVPPLLDEIDARLARGERP